MMSIPRETIDLAVSRSGSGIWPKNVEVAKRRLSDGMTYREAGEYGQIGPERARSVARHVERLVKRYCLPT
jgi:hypothetical protein